MPVIVAMNLLFHCEFSENIAASNGFSLIQRLRYSIALALGWHFRAVSFVDRTNCSDSVEQESGALVGEHLWLRRRLWPLASSLERVAATVWRSKSNTALCTSFLAQLHMSLDRQTVACYTFERGRQWPQSPPQPQMFNHQGAALLFHPIAALRAMTKLTARKCRPMLTQVLCRSL